MPATSVSASGGGGRGGGCTVDGWRWKGGQKVRRVRIGPLARSGAPFRLSFLVPRSSATPENHPRPESRRSPSPPPPPESFLKIFFLEEGTGLPRDSRTALDVCSTAVLFRDSEFTLTNGACCALQRQRPRAISGSISKD